MATMKEYNKQLFVEKSGLIVHEPTDEELKLINTKYTSRPYDRTDLYVRKLYGVNDKVDRDRQRLPMEFIRDIIVPKSIGKAFGFAKDVGHPKDGRPGNGKIFKANIENKEGVNWGVFWFYTLRKWHEYEIDMMDSGIWDYVSIVFMAQDTEPVYDDDGNFMYENFKGDGDVIKFDTVVLGSQYDAMITKAIDGLKCQDCKSNRLTVKTVKEHLTNEKIEPIYKPEPEETENEIRIRMKDPKLFIEDSFRYVDIDDEKGIRSVQGKLKEDGPKSGMVIQAYRFDKDKGWTMDKAKTWVAEHKDYSIQSEIKDITAELNRRANTDKGKETNIPENIWLKDIEKEKLILRREYLRKLKRSRMTDEEKQTYANVVLKTEYQLTDDDIESIENAEDIITTVNRIKNYDPSENTMLALIEYNSICQNLSKVIEKEGRVLSSKNRAILRNLLDVIKESIGPLKELLDATEPQKSPAPLDDVKDSEVSYLFRTLKNNIQDEYLIRSLN